MFKFSLRLMTALTVFASFYSTTTAQTVGFDVTRIDNSAEACTDFFQYANGSWVKKTEIPAA